MAMNARTTAAFAALLALEAGGIVRAETPELMLPALVAELRTRNPSVAAVARRHDAARVAIGRTRALDDPSLRAMVDGLPLPRAPLPPGAQSPPRSISGGTTTTSRIIAAAVLMASSFLS
jgi:hypothetical protein